MWYGQKEDHSGLVGLWLSPCGEESLEGLRSKSGGREGKEGDGSGTGAEESMWCGELGEGGGLDAALVPGLSIWWAEVPFEMRCLQQV